MLQRLSDRANIDGKTTDEIGNWEQITFQKITTGNSKLERRVMAQHKLATTSATDV